MFEYYDGDSKNFHNSNAEKKLIWAVSRNIPDKIKEAVKEGADVNKTRNSCGYSPLIFAVREAHYEAVDMLVHLGANPHYKVDGWNPIMHAREYLPCTSKRLSTYKIFTCLLKRR